MNNIPNNGENDQSLRNDLDRIGDAYRQQQHEEPPELLDQAILNSAHRAVEKQPHWLQFGWLHGLTTAAVFVLALSLIFHQREQVPVYEDGIRVNDSSGLQRERAAKKQTEAVQSDDLRMEVKEESEKRQDAFRNAPVSTAPQNEAMKGLTGAQAKEPAESAGLSTYLPEGLKAKSDSVDRDAILNEAANAELLKDEAGLITDTPEIEIDEQPFPPAAIAVSIAGEADAYADAESDIEKKLQNIILLKQSGDEAWITELALFKQDYPDYPLPDELSE